MAQDPASSTDQAKQDAINLFVQLIEVGGTQNWTTALEALKSLPLSQISQYSGCLIGLHYGRVVRGTGMTGSIDSRRVSR